MAKSLLNLYIQRVSSGDDSYVKRLLFQVAERLIYVPISEETEKETAEVSVIVVTIKEAHRLIVPIFTTEKLLVDWCRRYEHTGESIAVFGADLGAALPEDAWVVINPGSDQSVELQPFMISELKGIASEQLPQDEPVAPELVEQVATEDLSESDSNANHIEELPQATPPVEGVDQEPEVHSKQDKKKRSFLEFLKLS